MTMYKFRKTTSATLLGTIMLFSSFVLPSMIDSANATHIINLTIVRNQYAGTYEVPGEPNQSDTADIRYVIGSSSTIKIDIVDADTGSVIRTTGDLVRSAGTYTWSVPSWTWESKADSYIVKAYHKSGSSYILNDEVRGFVQADKITQGTSSNYSPNMYTRALRSTINSSYDIFNFKYWYWDNTHNLNTDQGTPRLNTLKNLVQEGSFPGKFVTEFRRNVDGFDLGTASGFACLPISWNSNLPNPQVEVEESHCAWPNTDEEAEVFTHDDQSMVVNPGSDPSGEDTQGYFSEFTALKKTPGTSVELTMEFEVEKCVGCTPFEITEATKQTEVV